MMSVEVERIDLSEEILQAAVEIKATCALSLADSWIIATARVRDAILVHKDPEFLQVKSIVQLYNLPFKDGKAL